jgi:hypothetical protein
MISTNRIFESAHGPEIPNFLEIVAGLYSIGLPRRLAEERYQLPAFSACASSTQRFDTVNAM